MKKFTLLIAVMFIAAIGFSQGASSFKTEAGATSATLTNADTVFLYYDLELKIDRIIGISATADTLTGTNAVVTCTLQGSVDGVEWGNLEAAKTLVALGPDTGHTGLWYYPHLYFPYYRQMFIQTGTATTSVKSSFYLKR